MSYCWSHEPDVTGNHVLVLLVISNGMIEINMGFGVRPRCVGVSPRTDTCWMMFCKLLSYFASQFLYVKTLLGMAKVKKIDNMKCLKDLEQLELLHFAEGVPNGIATLESSF